MRDDAIAGIETKRHEHLQSLMKAYEKLAVEEKKKIQTKLINNHQLDKKEFEKEILGIV